MMRRDHLNERVGKLASIVMTCALEYVASEVLEISGNYAEENHKKRINNRHILLAIKKDDELSKLFHNIIVHEGGVLPHIEQRLLQKKKGGKDVINPTQEV